MNFTKSSVFAALKKKKKKLYFVITESYILYLKLQ